MVSSHHGRGIINFFLTDPLTHYTNPGEFRFKWSVEARSSSSWGLLFHVFTPLTCPHRDMVSLLPRLSSFAVSGTPARAQVADLIHVLKYVFALFSFPVVLDVMTPRRFLRVDGLVGSLRMWNRLLKPGFAHLFSALFEQYTIRYDRLCYRHPLFRSHYLG